MHFPIGEKLKNLKSENRIPFHMPGHKRKRLNLEHMDKIESESLSCDITQYDITEINGYDNLHHPEGIILESMNLLKDIYHSRKSWYLVNGSTCGILSAISAVCKLGDGIILSRNCHKSVYNAIRLLHLHPYYIYPSYSRQFDMMQGIMEDEREEMENLLRQHAQIKAVVITSPTYEGIVSDIAAIKAVLAPYHIPLIVDEAHGAHFIFHEYFPKSAVECGADIVIQSAHKTLPSFTQTALLHLCSDLPDEKEIEEMLSIYQSSSPSYLLMASAEYGVIYTQNHRDQVNKYVDKLEDFRSRCAQLKNIHLLRPEDIKGFDYDRGKLVFLVKNTAMDGKKLFDELLNHYHIELEMDTAFYGIAMTSIMDEEKDFQKLWDAIFEIDQKLEQLPFHKITDSSQKNISIFSCRPERKYEVWEIKGRRKERIPFEEGKERIAAEYVYLYPPGIPILLPGEKITKEIVENMKYYLYNGYNLPSLSDGRIDVLISL